MKASTSADASTPPPAAHGGRILAARRRWPRAPEPWIDLSTGINPVPYPVPPLPAEALTRLPEPEAVAALEAAAAAAYRVPDPACVAAAPGTQALIHLLPRLLPPCRVAVLSPTYAEHAAAWRLAGHDVKEVAALPDAAGADIAILVRPNNPDGAVTDEAAILALAASLALRGGTVLVDEAFADLEGCSLAPLLPRPGLLLLRSFGKTFGLAGVRLGFALAAPGWADRLRAALGPWAVSGPALHAGSHALPDVAWRQAAARRLAAEAERLDGLLAGHGFSLAGGTRLFRLHAHRDAPAVAGALGRAGILVRSFDGRPDLLRFGLPGSAEAWARLGAACRGIC